jgi:hypothetical protein
MPIYPVFIETGKKRVFAGAPDWPGWARSGKDEAAALQALLAYAPRFAQTLAAARLDFTLPASPADFEVLERHPGNITTDFGAPDAALGSDSTALSASELARFQAVLQASWQAFERTAAQAAGKSLQTGPRGGGRDLEKITEHVLAAERAYLRRLACKVPDDAGMEHTRQAAQAAFTAAVTHGLPEAGPRGGRLWTPRFYARRSAWHLLDHAWELEDRILLK